MRGLFIVAALFAFVAGSVMTGAISTAEAKKDCTYTSNDKKKGYRC
jgi:hypothetical protein